LVIAINRIMVMIVMFIVVMIGAGMGIRVMIDVRDSYRRGIMGPTGRMVMKANDAKLNHHRDDGEEMHEFRYVPPGHGLKSHFVKRGQLLYCDELEPTRLEDKTETTVGKKVTFAHARTARPQGINFNGAMIRADVCMGYELSYGDCMVHVCVVMLNAHHTRNGGGLCHDTSALRKKTTLQQVQH